MHFLPKKLQGAYAPFIVFAVLVLVFYGSTMQNGFVYDDHEQVENNIYIQSLSYLPRVITSCVWEHSFGQCKDRIPYYRPVQSLSYLVTYQISSHPAFFHFVNLSYFLAAAYLVFILGRILSRNFLFAFLAALIFLIHPINSEVVNWISAVPELTLAIFVLLALIFYAKSRFTAQELELPFWRDKNFLLAVLFYFLAMLSKEPGVLLVTLFVFLDVFFFRIPLKKLASLAALKRYALLIAAPMVYLAMRVGVLGGVIGETGKYYDDFSMGERVYAFFTLFAQYLSKLVWPYPPTFYYYFEQKADFASITFILSFVVTFAFLTALAFALYKKRSLLAFIFAWMFVFLASSLVSLEGLGESIFTERYLFIPSIAFAFFVSYIVTYLLQRAPGFAKIQSMRIIFAALALVVLGASFALIFTRNGEWRNDETLYLDTLAKTPRAYPIRFNWAVLLRNQKEDFEAAKQEFETILEQNPQWRDTTMIYLHLGDYERDVGDEARAIELYERSIADSFDGKEHFALGRLGSIYAGREDHLKALPYFCQAVEAYSDSETDQERLQRIISLVVAAYEDNPSQLYGDLTTEGRFEKIDEERVRYTNRACDEGRCTFFFASRFEETEIIFPFVIAASDYKGGGVEVQDSAFNPETAQIALTLADIYEDTALTFIFPTCDGIYYEATAR